MVLKPDTERCANEEVEPRRGWTRGGVLARTLGPEGVWIGRSHIDWRREQVPARTLGSEGGGLWDPTSIREGEQSILYKDVETSPKKGKPKEDNMC